MYVIWNGDERTSQALRINVKSVRKLHRAGKVQRWQWSDLQGCADASQLRHIAEIELQVSSWSDFGNNAAANKSA